MTKIILICSRTNVLIRRVVNNFRAISRVAVKKKEDKARTRTWSILTFLHSSSRSSNLLHKAKIWVVTTQTSILKRPRRRVKVKTCRSKIMPLLLLSEWTVSETRLVQIFTSQSLEACTGDNRLKVNLCIISNLVDSSKILVSNRWNRWLN